VKFGKKKVAHVCFVALHFEISTLKQASVIIIHTDAAFSCIGHVPNAHITFHQSHFTKSSTGRPRTAWMDNIKTWTGLSVEKSIRMTEDRDKWKKYVHGVANPRIEDD